MLAVLLAAELEDVLCAAAFVDLAEEEVGVELEAKLCRKRSQPRAKLCSASEAHRRPGLASLAIGTTVARMAVDEVPVVVAMSGVDGPVAQESVFSMELGSFGDANGDDEPDERSGKFHREEKESAVSKRMTGPS